MRTGVRTVWSRPRGPRGSIARIGIALAAAVFALGGCRARPPRPPFTGAPFLLVWAGDADRRDSDFLAVIDANPESTSYGAVVHTVPVGSSGNEPYAMERRSSPDGLVFAGGLLSGRTFVFDVHDPAHARLVHVDTPGPGRRYASPRAYLRLGNGHRVVTLGDRLGYRGGALELLYEPGGVGEFDPSGRLLRELDAGDPGAAGMIISPHAIALSAGGDRLLTTDAGHGYGPVATEWVPGVSVQVREATTGRLIQTIPLPVGDRGDENLGPKTAHFLERGDVAVVSTAEGAALHASWSIATGAPAFNLVYDFGVGSLPGDSVITANGRYYVQALTGANRVEVLDIANPRRPRRAGGVRFDRNPAPPHEPREGGPRGLAIDVDGRRVAVSDCGIDVPASQRDGDRHVHVLRLDPDDGELRFDPGFRDELGGGVGIDFDRTRWPHGNTGPARPAAVLFVPPLPPEGEGER